MTRLTNDDSHKKTCLLLRLGVTDYPEAQELQRDVARRRGEGTLPDALLLLQHPHTYTLGRRAGQSDVLLESDALEEIGARVYSVDRGGEATYHGPGQIVGYPVVDVRSIGGATGYVRTLETLLIAALGDFGIAAQRRNGLPGSWVDNEKIAFIGVRIGRGITTHGFALNVNPDLSYFRHIVPCGMEDMVVTSMERILGRPIALEDVADSLARHFSRLFNRDMVEIGPEQLRGSEPLDPLSLSRAVS